MQDMLHYAVKLYITNEIHFLQIDIRNMYTYINTSTYIS